MNDVSIIDRFLNVFSTYIDSGFGLLHGEVAFLTVHSMLHLLGYDHENGGLEAMRMREKEEAVLTQLGLPRTVSYTE